MTVAMFCLREPPPRDEQPMMAARALATMQPWYPFTRTSRPSFDERLASLTRVTNSILYENSLRISVGSTRRRVSPEACIP